ncbi:predicted protein [Uncinocarpus reesii 1704]|uniref:Uncharacterized protein n=1 Tax=Uncinocarpus reesii (strain UAMH 1704) TaxID=336963 RepID=C4JJI3_UNCRE|nr:uncharacterized protein UREG_01790 [Uncinocarpus reesii 1704]EEP76941.1 predicted protein [Uncinocarpus reesii 1704]
MPSAKLEGSYDNSVGRRKLQDGDFCSIPLLFPHKDRHDGCSAFGSAYEPQPIPVRDLVVPPFHAYVVISILLWNQTQVSSMGHEPPPGETGHVSVLRMWLLSACAGSPILSTCNTAIIVPVIFPAKKSLAASD